MANSVVFKRIQGVNFFRFGNEEFVFDFKKGVTGLFGENGLGKSAILDAICVCAFGETYRKSNKDDWTNNINKSGLFLKLTVDVVSTTTDTYEIIRRPTARKTADRIVITKNGDILTDINDFQNTIETKILGFGINMFRNSIAVSAGTPFISMTPEQKRQFSDNLFSIKQVREYKKKASEALSEVNVGKRILEQDINGLNAKIAEYRNMLAVSSKRDDRPERILAIRNEITNIDRQIGEWNGLVVTNNAEIAQYGEKIIILNAELAGLEARLVELNPHEFHKKIAAKKIELEVCRRDYLTTQAGMKRISPNVVCTSCGNSFSEEQAAHHIELHKNEMAELAVKGSSLKAQVVDLEAGLPEINNLNDRISKLKYDEIAQCTSKISALRAGLSQATSYVTRLEMNKTIHLGNISAIENEVIVDDVSIFANNAIETATVSIEGKTLEVSDLSAKIKAYTYIVNMCSDSGIKNLLLKQFMPILNKLIAHYLSVFSLPVKVEFDEYFEHTLTAESGIGHKHSLLSTGQKKRIDVAILFAIVDLIKMMGNFNCNLLILDEFADGGVDLKGFADIVNMIRTVADRDKKAIVVVSHKNEDVLYDNLDYMYELSLKNSFSILSEVQNF